MQRVLISGICGFVGSHLALYLQANCQVQVLGIDNLSRDGSWHHRKPLQQAGIRVSHGDVRLPSDIHNCGPVDWVIDAAANPSVLAGLGSDASSRQLVESNLLGTHNLLEHCKAHSAGFILLSSSRVYSIATLAGLALRNTGEAFEIDDQAGLPRGVSAHGISEVCSTSAPISLYGATKLCSEALALEYMHAFDIPVWINRCGVLAGSGQFGTADQGIFAYWLNAWRLRKPLKYIGYGGGGWQTRDCMHPSDLARLLKLQMQAAEKPWDHPRLFNVAGGNAASCSLRQLSKWCEDRWGSHFVTPANEHRPYDLPWIVLDCRLAQSYWNWQPSVPLSSILDEIASFVEIRPLEG